MTNDADNISTSLSMSLVSLLSGVLMLIGTIAVMLTYSFYLTLISCISVILTVVITKLMVTFIRKYYLKKQELLGKLNSTAEEMIANSKTRISCCLGERAQKEFTETSDELTKAGIIAEIAGNSIGPLMNTMSNIGFILVTVAGGIFAVKGYITIGTISAFIVLSKQFSRPVNELAQVFAQLSTSLACAERIFTVLDSQEEDYHSGKELSKVEGEIEFRNVNFSYVEGSPVIQNFSLVVKPGYKIALVGTTGSGKTTLINLLLRFYDPDSGEILLDGKNIKDYSLVALRDSIGIVLQDTVLFSDTIRNNLTYAGLDIPEEKMQKAALETHCAQYIEKLPEGFDSKLENAGENLSQGERQLCAVCRAFLSDPEILILDEATSNVDTRTEKHVQEAMQKLMKGHTSLIIAHRLSTILDADRIVVMDKGSIVEEGSHKELMAKKGCYYDLFMTQYAGNAI